MIAQGQRKFGPVADLKIPPNILKKVFFYIEVYKLEVFSNILSCFFIDRLRGNLSSFPDSQYPRASFEKEDR